MVSVAIPSSAVRRARPEPEPLLLDVLYEDDYLMAINKQAGMVVHPSYKQYSGTLLNAVLARVHDRIDAQPGILTRLDKGTSGIVIVALSPHIHSALQDQARHGQIAKEYLAVVHGRPDPPSGRIHFPLARDPADRRRVIVLPTGAPSETAYDAIGSLDTADGPISLVRCMLVTGRTHQIRVHFEASGWPILGDPLYGRPSAQIARQALHAWRIAFTHPITGQRLTVVAPLPTDIHELAGALGQCLPPN